MVQLCLQTRQFPCGMTWSPIVLILKGGGDFRGIGLLEVSWKAIKSIINACIIRQVDFHPALHGCVPRRGTGTALVEAKLIQQLAVLQQLPYYTVFLDLRKAFDTVDRSRSLDILEAYGVGPTMLVLIRNYWKHQQCVARQKKFFGPAFQPGQRVTQGGIISGTLFNVLVDTVVWHWLKVCSDEPDNDACTELVMRVTDTLRHFLAYVDDTSLGSEDPIWLQNSL